MARVVAVYLVIQGNPDEAEIADGVGELLRPAEHEGYLLDWGYHIGNFPEDALYIEEADYTEGDFYNHPDVKSQEK
jgi:hypothetical protein